MKKLFLSIIIFSIAFVSFASGTVTKEYISKSIPAASGYDASAWIATGIWIDLKNPVAVITLEGYKTFADKEAGKASMGSKNVTVSGLSAQPVYAAMHDTIVSIIKADPDFAGATLQTVEVPIPEPVTNP